jgi:hypothetical protein
MADETKTVSRREFLRFVAYATSALAAACGGVRSMGDGGAEGGLDAAVESGTGGEAAMTADASGVGLPHLGGAPNTNDGRAIAAFVDTVVPGRFRDPTGAIGGIDVGAPGLFFDPELPAARLVTLLRLILDGVARDLFAGRVFAALSFEERDRALEIGLMRVPELEFGIQLAKLAFYSSQEAGRAIGYPGPNPGYVRDPDFSFGRAMAREITRDGNLP